MRSIRDEQGKAIAFVNRGPHERANAVLIVAAPQLLACVEYLIDNPEVLAAREAARELLREIDAESHTR